MPGPYDYLGGIQPVDLSPQVQSIAANLGGGLATALQVNAARLQAQQQAQLQAQQQAAFAEDMRDYAAAPSVEKFGLMLGKYPSMQKQLEEVQKRLGEEDKRSALSFISPTLSLLQGGKTDLAVEMIRRRNEALANSGEPNKAALIANGEAMISAIESGDEGVNAAIGSLIRDYALASGTADPAKLMETQAGLPYEASYAEARSKELQAKAEGEAEKAKEQAIKTGFAAEVIEAGVAKDLAQAANYAAMADVAREQNKIEWYKARLQKAKTDLEAQNLQLQIREAQQKRNGLVMEKKADLDLASATLDSAIELVKKIKATPDDVRRAAHGPIDVKAPTVQQDVADYIGLVETLKAKNFSVATKGLNMAGVAKAETDKLQDSLGSLDLAQSTKQMDYWLRNIENFSNKNKQVLQDKFNATPGAAEATAEPLVPVDY
jgi:hypothetical protein